MSNRERVVSALFSLDPGCEREAWVRILMAFHAAGGSFEDADAWSAGAHNYVGSKDVLSVWQSFKGDGVKAGTLFHMARATGWREDSVRRTGNSAPQRITTSPVRVAPQSAISAALAAWNAGESATPTQDYIRRKRLLCDGLRVYRGPLVIKDRSVDGWLMMPGFGDAEGKELRTLQFIGPDAKLHFPGLTVDGFYRIGKIDGEVYLGEGLGAAHSCHQATGRGSVASFGAGNTARAAQWILDRGARPVIVADKGKESQAADIARALDCAWVEMPPDAPANFDINDLHAASDLASVSRYLTQSIRRHARKYALLSPSDMLALPPIRWRIKGLLPEEGVGVIGGASTAGKTFIALDLALRIASGAGFFGHRVYSCPVIFLALEGAGGFAGRLRAWSREFGTVSDRVHFLVRQAFDIRSDQDRAELCRTLADIGYSGGVIIIDTLAQAAVGMEENSSEGMGQAIAGMQALQQAVGGLVLSAHHLGKDASKGLRGHSSLFAACDVVMEVSRENDVRTWKISKSKDGRDSEAYGFELADVEIGTDREGDPVTSCVVRETGQPIVKVTPMRGDRQVMANDVVGGLLRDSNQLGKGGAPMTRPCVSLDAAVEAIGERLTCADFKRNNEARKLLMSLQRHNAIVVSGGWIWTP